MSCKTRWSWSGAHGELSHGAQVSQQPPDSLLQLREAGQRVSRLQFFHPRLQPIQLSLHPLQAVADILL